jgi:hypothetical protein
MVYLQSAYGRPVTLAPSWPRPTRGSSATPCSVKPARDPGHSGIAAEGNGSVCPMGPAPVWSISIEQSRRPAGRQPRLQSAVGGEIDAPQCVPKRVQRRS